MSYLSKEKKKIVTVVMIATTFIRYKIYLVLAIQVYQILFFGVKFLLAHFPNGYTQLKWLVTQDK